MNSAIVKIFTITSTTPIQTSKPVRFRPHPCITDSFILIWLDKHILENLNDEYFHIFDQLQSIIHKIKIFNTVEQCIGFLRKVKHQKVFMIISDPLSQQIIPYIHHTIQIDSFYVLGRCQSEHEQWAQQWTKVKGVFTRIEPICDLLKQTIHTIKQNFKSLSFLKSTDIFEPNLYKLDQSFIYVQILKEILLEIKYNEQSLHDLVSYCQSQYVSEPKELEFIKKFVRNYHKHSPIYWYTYPGIIHSMVNQALRTRDIDTVIRMGFFIQDLYKAIKSLHTKQTSDQDKQSFIVYRGQGLSKYEFEQLLKAKGELISFNSFLSTSKCRDVSLEFARNALNNSDLVGVLFKMVIDPSEFATPYALIGDQSYFENEEEILFSMHTVFRIGEVKQINKDGRLYQAILTLTTSRNKQLSALTDLLHRETQDSTGWYRLSTLLIKLGKFEQAEQMTKILFNMNTDDNEKALLYHQIGLIKRNLGRYTEALSFNKQTLNIYKQQTSSYELDLVATYNNIGYVHDSLGNYSGALLFYEKSLEISKQILPDDHTSLAILYNNMGVTYKNMGNYNRALEYYEQTLNIEQKTLPSNHPSLAISYKNMAGTYHNMGQHSKALSLYEKALEIEEKTLPLKHSSLAVSYNNIGLLYDNLGDHSKALSFYEKTLEIYDENLHHSHPDFAICYNNIGSIYRNMNEHKTALIFYKKALDIEEKLLPTHHPSLAISYNNIAVLYNCMEQYAEALISHEKALNIYQKMLPSEHPTLAISYNNIASIYDNKCDYKTALEYYKKALEIEEKVLPSTHPNLATSYNNIGLIYLYLGDYEKALVSLEKALNIYEQVLPSNHPSLATAYNNIGLVYRTIQDYTKSAISYEKAIEIYTHFLPSYLDDLLACYRNVIELYEFMDQHSMATSTREKLVHIQAKNISISTKTCNHIDRIIHEQDISVHSNSSMINTTKHESCNGQSLNRKNLQQQQKPL